MIGVLFNKWLNHFIHHIGARIGISPTNRNLLILDGHNSHVTIDIVEMAREVRLDLLTLPSHTSFTL